MKGNLEHWTWFHFFLISVPVGLVGRLTGLGGASILIPILVFFGLPIKEAIASGLVSVIATSSGSASAYVRDRLANIKIAMYLEMFTSVGAIIGATITTLIAPGLSLLLLCTFLMTSFLKLKHGPEPGPLDCRTYGGFPDGLKLDGGATLTKRGRKTIAYRAECPLLGGVGMMIAGLAAGMLGIGAGAFKVTVQENILKLPAKVASTTSNFIVGMTALAGISVYFFSGLLNLTLMAPMAIGTTVGGDRRGRVLNRLNDRVLRLLFCFVVTLLIVQMLYKGMMSL